jgi:hypothetical protein
MGGGLVCIECGDGRAGGEEGEGNVSDACAVATVLIVWHGGPYTILVAVLLADVPSGLHLMWAVGKWERPKSATPTAGPRGRYWSGPLHLVLTLAVSGALLWSPVDAVSYVSRVLLSADDALFAASSDEDAKGVSLARTTAVIALVLGLFYAQHGPNTFVAAAGARISMILLCFLYAFFRTDAASFLFPALVSPPPRPTVPHVATVKAAAIALLSTFPSLLSTPLLIVEHLLRFRPANAKPKAL